MNHSCEPNSFIRDREVIAKRDIEPWEAVTFDYNTTEWEMAEPSSCSCGSENCLETIQGLKFPTTYQRERLGNIGPYLNCHLLEESQTITELSQA